MTVATLELEISGLEAAESQGDPRKDRTALKPAAIMTSGESSPQAGTSKGVWIAVLVGMLLLFAYVFFMNAWVVDDAYITFRTVDNFVHGYGLRWNVDERVQVFTHPLWTFVMIGFYFFTGEAFFTSIAICFLLCIEALLIACYCLMRAPDSPPWKPSLLILLLIGSKAFIDYTSAGLENALSYLLVVLFYAKILFSAKHPRDFTAAETAWLYLLAALAFFNRQDTLVLFFPALIYLLVVHLGKSPWRTVGVLVGATAPAWLWVLFAILYFGYPFPNTAYAKLFNASIPTAWKLLRGVDYYVNSFRWDTPSHLIVLAALALSLKDKSAPSLLALGGVFLYAIYIFTSAASATHMSGRFFSVPFLIGALVFVHRVRSPKIALAAAAVMVAFILVHPLSSIKMGTRFYKPHKPVPSDFDTKWEVYQEGAALLNYRPGGKLPAHPFYRDGEKLRQSDARVHIGGGMGGGAIGYFAFAAGPDKYIVDFLGLSDPLLARLPSIPPPSREEYLSGHFPRDIPDGYVESVETKSNLIESEPLRLYYEKVRTVTRAPLFAPGRLREIWDMNLGKNRHLIEAYLKSVDEAEHLDAGPYSSESK